MNDIHNKLLLAGDNFIPGNLNLPTVLVEHLPKIIKESKSSEKQEIQDIFTEVNQIKPAFNIIWLMENLNI